MVSGSTSKQDSEGSSESPPVDVSPPITPANSPFQFRTGSEVPVDDSPEASVFQRTAAALVAELAILVIEPGTLDPLVFQSRFLDHLVEELLSRVTVLAMLPQSSLAGVCRRESPTVLE